MNSNWEDSGAVQYMVFNSTAIDTAQEYGSCPSAKLHRPSSIYRAKCNPWVLINLCDLIDNVYIHFYSNCYSSKLTESRISQLLANDTSIPSSKWWVTDSAPGTVKADLHSAFIGSCTINKSHITVWTVCWWSSIHCMWKYSALIAWNHTIASVWYELATLAGHSCIDGLTVKPWGFNEIHRTVTKSELWPNTVDVSNEIGDWSGVKPHCVFSDWYSTCMMYANGLQRTILCRWDLVIQKCSHCLCHSP